jgi:hypothetical protein
MIAAVLVLEDGRTFAGQAYGAIGEAFGEAVFTTGMTGYQETALPNWMPSRAGPGSPATSSATRRASPATGAHSAHSTNYWWRMASSASAESTPGR